MVKRAQAVLDRFPGQTPVLMLSGGVDSILLAAVLSELAPDTVAVNVGLGASNAETETARKVADHFGLRFEHVARTPRELAEEARDVAARLDTADPWEVLAGLILDLCLNRRDSLGLTGPVFTGGGADVLFLGGKNLDLEGSEQDVVTRWGQEVQKQINKGFIRMRNIPDFYERVMHDPEKHVLFWQTHAAVQLAQSISPYAVRGKDLSEDKLLFREIARDLGTPSELLVNQKDPMQVSSGGLQAIVDGVREYLAEQTGEHDVYTNPQTEPLEFTVARLWLEKARTVE